MENPRIYMDHHATTPVDPDVVAAMLPTFTEEFGNAASRTHAYGWKALEAVEAARETIARLVGAGPVEIVFTSGATESDNLAIFGAAQMLSERGRHIVTGSTEHPAVLDCCRRLEKIGFEVTYLPVDRTGMVSPDSLRAALRPDTILISLMAANNEVGTLHPVGEIGKIAKEKGVVFHCDAAQAAGRIPLDVEAMGIDLLSFTAHKMYGPKGVGALYVRKRNPRVRLMPQIYGGGHERGMRSGTLNVPGIVGFAKACEIAARVMPEEAVFLAGLRDRLHHRIEAELEEVALNGHPVQRLPNNLNLSFAYVEGESLMMALNGVAVSSGSACTSASQEPSHVLKAMGVSDDLIHTSLRFGLGRFNTREEVDQVSEKVIASVRKLREISPLYEASRRRGGRSHAGASR
ncbi:MAG TPA: IscS subfamily cysteine desulfurase [Candidatus Polarisedimenticolia bacterium]|nr:IscS subfamily cysteine desulfurase [Candidatus Polarisedimenticolia bacterium]